MAGLFDLHALISLQNGWRRFIGSTATAVTGTDTIADGQSSASVVFVNPLPHADWTVKSLVGDGGLGALSTTGHSKTGFTINSATPAAGGNGAVSWGIDPVYGLANFRRLFPMVETDAIDSWYAGLVVDSEVTFRSFASPGHDDFPLVIVQLAGESPHTEILGNAARPWEDGTPDQYVDGLIVSQEITITAMTKTQELTRALFTAIRAILLRYTPMFIEAGYVGVKYQGAQELAPEELLIAEDAGVYVRRMTWRALSQIEAFPIEDGSVGVGKPWFVLVDDIVTSINPTPPPDRVVDVDGVPGGVVGYSD